VATTTITIWRAGAAAQYAEPYDAPPARTAVDTGVRAVIEPHPGRESGRERVQGGEQVRVQLRLICDPCDIDHLDLVEDERTGRTYRVGWMVPMGDPGGTVSHLEGGLDIIEGLV
jgi:hypothetical protein